MASPTHNGLNIKEKVCVCERGARSESFLHIDANQGRSSRFSVQNNDANHSSSANGLVETVPIIV